MTSQARIEANRRNALKSTGPRTPEGLARSAQNARKHGLTTRQSACDAALIARLEASQQPDSYGASARHAIAAWALATSDYLRIQAAAARLFDAYLRAGTQRPQTRRAADRLRRQGLRMLRAAGGAKGPALAPDEAATYLAAARDKIRIAFDRDDARAAFETGRLLRAIDRAEARALSRMRRADLHMIEATEQDAMAFEGRVLGRRPHSGRETKPIAPAVASPLPDSASRLGAPTAAAGRIWDNTSAEIASTMNGIGRAGLQGALTGRRVGAISETIEAKGHAAVIAAVTGACAVADEPANAAQVGGARRHDPPADAAPRRAGSSENGAVAQNEAKGQAAATRAISQNEPNFPSDSDVQIDGERKGNSVRARDRGG